jgi:hypothetical protein
MRSLVINSAALYFRAEGPERVPTQWLDRAIDFLGSLGASPDYFDVAETAPFSSDETYDFSGNQGELFDVVNQGLVQRVGLYSDENPDAPRSDWKAMASVEMALGMMFLGVDAARLSDHRLLLQFAYKIGELLGVKYGISYERSHAEGPDSYAAGVLQGSLADIEHWLVSEDENQRRITAWANEKYGARRYLDGLFRGAYPASIISFQHLLVLRRCVGTARYPGRISPLVEKRLWIWELERSEIASAETLLKEGHLLVQ